jgi:hypothetical protein
MPKVKPLGSIFTEFYLLLAAGVIYSGYWAWQ